MHVGLGVGGDSHCSRQCSREPAHAPGDAMEHRGPCVCGIVLRSPLQNENQMLINKKQMQTTVTLPSGD
jgi:hypothetical protein